MLAGTAPWTARLWTGRTIAAAAGGVLTRNPSLKQVAKEEEGRGAKGEQGSGGRLGEISELETGNLTETFPADWLCGDHHQLDLTSNGTNGVI